MERRRERCLVKDSRPQLPRVDDASIFVLPTEATTLDCVCDGGREVVTVGTKDGVHVLQMSGAGAPTEVAKVASGDGVLNVRLGLCRKGGEGGGRGGGERGGRGECSVLLFATLGSGAVRVYGLLGDQVVEIMSEVCPV